MAIIIKLTFPAGRYHATPWGRHVNEGVPEWPPSPWRLLRALVAAWKRTMPDELSEPEFRRMLEPLLEPPSFRLPAHRVAHTRHYMPWEKKGPGDRTRIFDAFVSVGRDDPLYVIWSGADLAAEDRSSLGQLLSNISFLGRAESWVIADLVGSGEVEPNCVPEASGDPVRVLCADPATALGDEHYPTVNPKSLRKGIKPGDRLFDCPRWHLCLDTQTIQERRWSGVPGSKWTDYNRPREATLEARSPRSASRKVTFARFTLDGPVLPTILATLPLAEAARARLISMARQDGGNIHEVAPAFWGKDELGAPLRGHRHAFFLPVDEDDDGHLDHLVVFAPMGFGETERRSLDGLRWLRLGDPDHAIEMSLALVGLGEPEDFARSRLLGPSDEWVSATPYLVTRYPKKRDHDGDPVEQPAGPSSREDFVRHVLSSDLERRAGLVPLECDRISVEDMTSRGIGPRGARAYTFRRRRPKPGDASDRRPHGAFRLKFESEVRGPIALGHLCHLGLGLFVKPGRDQAVSPR